MKLKVESVKLRGGKAALLATALALSLVASAADASVRGADILVTCAGGNEARCCKSNVPFCEQPVEVIDWGLDVNLKGAVYFARAVMPQMVAK